MIEPIKNEDIEAKRVSNLSTRPNAPTAMGGSGLSAQQLRAKFDELPYFAIKQLQALINAILAKGNDSIVHSIKTGIPKAEGDEYTLGNILGAISSGDLAKILFCEIDEELKSLDEWLKSKAPLDSPSFYGFPELGEASASTPAINNVGGRVATTAWVVAWAESYLLDIKTVFEKIQNGLYGNLPKGGEANDVLLKTSATDHETAWTPLKSYEFENPTANTQSWEDDSTKVATTAFVQALLRHEIEKLKGGAEEAYDTLLELAEAIKANDNDIADALNTIAEKDNKTVFRTFKDEANIALQNSTEYRADGAMSTLTLTFPQNPTDDFITSLLFTTSSTTDMNLTYNGSHYMTGDDCTSGQFYPLKNKHYTVVIWYGGGKFQGVVRRSA